jgi:F-type H+-transporting ATPase subunit gamma
MPSLIDIRRRIRAVKSTQQITKAMKMIAASRLRKAHERIVAARPFSHGMLRVLYSLAGRVDPSAGSFNSNVLKATASFIVERRGQQIVLGLVGRKGRDFFRRRGLPVRVERVNLFSRLSSADAEAVAGPAIEDFMAGELDGVYVVYNEFKSMMAQRVVVDRLLPIPRLGDDMAALAPSSLQRAYTLDRDGEGRVDPASQVDYIYEPDPTAILNALLPRYVEQELFHALLESAAAEHAARMTAMDAATKNAVEMLDSLTLYMNKVRQANITREIIEVVSGAETR